MITEYPEGRARQGTDQAWEIRFHVMEITAGVGPVVAGHDGQVVFDRGYPFDDDVGDGVIDIQVQIAQVKDAKAIESLRKVLQHDLVVDDPDVLEIAVTPAVQPGDLQPVIQGDHQPFHVLDVHERAALPENTVGVVGLQGESLAKMRFPHAIDQGLVRVWLCLVVGDLLHSGSLAIDDHLAVTRVGHPGMINVTRIGCPGKH